MLGSIVFLNSAKDRRAPASVYPIIGFSGGPATTWTQIFGASNPMGMRVSPPRSPFPGTTPGGGSCTPNICTRPSAVPPRTTAPALGPEPAEPTQAVQSVGCSTTISSAILSPGGPVLHRRSPCRWAFLQPHPARILRVVSAAWSHGPAGTITRPVSRTWSRIPRAGFHSGTGCLGRGDAFAATWGPQPSTWVHGWCSNRN